MSTTTMRRPEWASAARTSSAIARTVTASLVSASSPPRGSACYVPHEIVHPQDPCEAPDAQDQSGTSLAQARSCAGTPPVLGARPLARARYCQIGRAQSELQSLRHL